MFTKTIYMVIDVPIGQFGKKLQEAYDEGWKPCQRPVPYEYYNSRYPERWMLATVEKETV